MEQEISDISEDEIRIPVQSVLETFDDEGTGINTA